MPSPDNQPLDGTTRYDETKEGIKSYAQITNAVMPKLTELYRNITQGKYDQRELREDLIQELHAKLCSHLYEWAGTWRDREVNVSNHKPPPYYEIPVLMRQYVDDLQARLQHHEEGLEAETLAFAEWKLTHIHPFRDFNGRVSRLVAAIIVKKLKLPPILTEIAPNKTILFAALHEADHGDLSHMIQIWSDRLSKTPGEQAQDALKQITNQKKP